MSRPAVNKKSLKTIMLSFIDSGVLSSSREQCGFLGQFQSTVITVLATAEIWYSWTLVLTEAIVDTLMVSA